MNTTETFNELKLILSDHIPPLKISKESANNFEVTGTKETMQGKQKVDGIYFASVVPKEKDVRFYFFPVYTHADYFNSLPDELKKCLKGKSCFHIKNFTPQLKNQLVEMVDKGVELYKKENLI